MLSHSFSFNTVMDIGSKVSITPLREREPWASCPTQKQTNKLRCRISQLMRISTGLITDLLHVKSSQQSNKIVERCLGPSLEVFCVEWGLAPFVNSPRLKLLGGFGDTGRLTHSFNIVTTSTPKTCREATLFRFNHWWAGRRGLFSVNQKHRKQKSKIT